MKAIVLDAKGDTPWMLRHQGVLSLNDLEFSLVACPPYSSPTEFINRWLMHFRESFWTAELQSAVLLPVLREVIRSHHPASVIDIVDRIRQRDKSPAGKAAADRLESISLPYPKLYESSTNRWSELHERSLYCPIIGTLTPATRFVTWLLIIERFAYLQHREQRDRVHTVVFLDEAQTSLSKRTQTISGLPSTPVQLLPTTREHGLQFIVATPSWTELDPLVLSQFQVQIALQPSDGRELDAITKSFRLIPAQTRLTSSMQLGTALGKIRGIGQPFLFTYAPFPEQKDIDAQTIAAARARAEHFSTSSNTAAREGIESTGQPTPSQKARPSSPPVAPAAENNAQQIPPNASRHVALNRHAAALLADAGDHPYTLTTTAYDRCGMHWTQGDRAKSLLAKLALLEAHKVTTGAGRGKTGSALCVTPSGWAWLGREPVPGTRGGDSVQHAFLVHELSRRITKSSIETLGADLVIPYDPISHERLLLALAALTHTAIALNTGDLLALEVEVSAPAKTVPRNITRDAGFSLTVIATLPKHLTLARRLVAHNALVVDVLRLLDQVRA